MSIETERINNVNFGHGFGRCTKLRKYVLVHSARKCPSVPIRSFAGIWHFRVCIKRCSTFQITIRTQKFVSLVFFFVVYEHGRRVYQNNCSGHAESVYKSFAWNHVFTRTHRIIVRLNGPGPAQQKQKQKRYWELLRRDIFKRDWRIFFLSTTTDLLLPLHCAYLSYFAYTLMQ